MEHSNFAHCAFAHGLPDSNYFSLCAPKGPNGAPFGPNGVPFGPNGTDWGPMRFHWGPIGSQWDPVGPMGPQWGPIGPNGVSLGPIGPQWGPIGPIGPHCVPMGRIGAQWGALGPNGAHGRIIIFVFAHCAGALIRQSFGHIAHCALKPEYLRINSLNVPRSIYISWSLASVAHLQLASH